MITKSFFQTPMGLQVVEVEVKLMPGIPQLHIVGQPDAHIKECSYRLKTALKSQDFKWPKGQQVVVNLRPTYLRKHSRGLELAIAVGFLLATEQVPKNFYEWACNKIFYGEVGLEGKVFAPADVLEVIDTKESVVTGEVKHPFAEGQWQTCLSLREIFQPQFCERQVNWTELWERPEVLDVDFNHRAAELLKISSLMNLSTLLAGPQGSGKSTWARALYSLTAPPDPQLQREYLKMFPDQQILKWRPLESPHHTTPPVSMVGGGTPLKPGVISKAHGGILLMDEFLQFPSPVLEALREPLETGKIHLNRNLSSAILPARFQLIGTTNLCPCGKLVPNMSKKCPTSLVRCRSVWQRLSGPMMDRFEVAGFSHDWQCGERVLLSQIREEIDQVREFQKTRAYFEGNQPGWLHRMPISFRRRKAVMRVGRALADLAGSEKIQDVHWEMAKDFAIHPWDELRELFA